MGKFYVLRDVYLPGAAPINRMLSFLRGFEEMGVDTEVVFFMPDKDRSKVNSTLYKHISFTYLWDSSSFSGRYSKYILGYLNALKFRQRLKSGDKVLMLGSVFPDILYGKRGVSYYQEHTEHPAVIPFYMVPFDKNRKRVIHYINKSDGLFVISTALKEFFSSKGMNEEKIHIVNMTVDSNRFEGIAKEKVPFPYIAYCGTASNNKDGVDELIKAFAIVNKNYPKYKLYIIGDTPSEEDLSGNYALVKRLGVQNSVVFTGRVLSDKIPQLLKNAQILALDRPDSLQAQNGFPTKLGEYLLTENPVVVTKVGDIPKFLTDGETALLAKERNSDDFASKIIWAIRNPEKASDIGKAGAKVALKYFNYQTESKKIWTIIK